ncbi:hypothetical protein JCM6882_004065 [Rhodosporidiobolus microsporus]
MPSSFNSPGSHRSLVDIRARLALQLNHTVTISAVATLVAELNRDWEREGRSTGAGGGGGAAFLQDRIDAFRFEWMMGTLTRVKPLDLERDSSDGSEGDEDYDAFSSRNGGGSVSQATTATTATNASSFVTASEGSTPTRPRPRPRRRALPSDATARGILAEETIKADLRRSRLLLDHDDFAPLGPVVEKAVKKVLRTGRAVYVSPGLVDGVDFVREFEGRGWASPGVRFGVLKPDLVRFEEVRVKEGERRRVSWEVVEVKYSGGARQDFIYTNYKVQALFYHLTLLRLLPPSPSLVPSHRCTFFISADPLSPTSYEERSISVRTELAHVEHHLFVLLPKWLGCVRKEEEERLREGLAQVEPSTPEKGSVPSFLSKLQHSVLSAPPSPSGRQRNHSPFTPGFSYSPSRSKVSPSRPPPRSPTPPSKARLLLHLPLPEQTERSNPFAPPRVGDLPPLPDVDEEEERALRELFEGVGIE